MLKVYLDLGSKADKSDDIASVAAIMFKPTKYKQFVRRWNAMLAPWGASAFHATDFYSGAEEFKRDTPQRKALFDEDCRRIPKILSDFIHKSLVVSFRPSEFLKEASPLWIRAFGKSFHSHAVQLCLIENGYWRERTCRHERFGYVMESGDKDGGDVVKTVELMRREEKTSPVIAISSFTTVDKGQARGLEAADFVAWHFNKYYMDKVRFGNWDNPRKDFEAFVQSSKNGVDYIFSSGEKLRYLFSLFPVEVLEAVANGEKVESVRNFRRNDDPASKGSA